MDAFYQEQEEHSNDPLDYMSKEEWEKTEMEASGINPKNWAFDINDPTLFDADPDYPKPEIDLNNPGLNANGEVVDIDAYLAYNLKTEQEHEEELAGVVDEETLTAYVNEKFNSEMRFAAPVVEGMLYRGSIAAIYGASHSGKTLATMSLCSCAARGEAFGDLRVRNGGTPVVYLNSESQGDFNKRYAALCHDVGLDDIPNFRAMHEPFDVRDPLERAKLLAALPKLFGEGHRPPIFVFDTLAQHLSGVGGEAIDENSAKDMGRYIFGLRRIAEATNGVVVLVAHSGKDGEKGIRGSSALRAALDTEIEVSGLKHQNKKLIRMRFTKQRFGDMLDPACYAIDSIILEQFNSTADVQIDEDDYLAPLPKRSDEQFTRRVAPSNQSAVMSCEPMPVPAKGADEEADSIRNGKISEADMTQAQHIVRILGDYFQGGQGDRDAVRERWVDDGLKKTNFPKAVADAEKKGLIKSMAGGMLATTVRRTANGNIGSAAEIAAQKFDADQAISAGNEGF